MKNSRSGTLQEAYDDDSFSQKQTGNTIERAETDGGCRRYIRGCTYQRDQSQILIRVSSTECYGSLVMMLSTGVPKMAKSK